MTLNIYFLSICRSRIWVQHSFVSLAKDVSWGCSQTVSQSWYSLRLQFGKDQLPSSLTWLLGELSSEGLSAWPLTRVAHSIPLASFRVSEHAQWKPLALCHLTYFGTPHSFSCILFSRRKSRNPAHTQRETATQGCGYQKVGSLGDLQGGCLPR